MDKIVWCLKKRRGIEIIEPNSNLSEAYIKKAQQSLEEMHNIKTKDWKITIAYYTMYFSLYAILMRVGVKSELHSCTIEFMKKFLSNYFTKDECALMEDAFNARIDMQYYTDRGLDDDILDKVVDMVPDFLVKCKNILLRITEKDINKIRSALRDKTIS